MMSITKERTVGQIVKDDYRTAQIFQQHGLDFCCGGGRTIEEACAKKDVDLNKIVQALNQITTDGSKEDNYDQWSLDFLVDYIVNNHHEFTRNKLPEIGKYAKKVAAVHGKRHEELNVIYYEFTMLHTEIFNHLDKEEHILFPYIKQLVEAEKEGVKPEKPEFGEAANPIAMMEDEHDEAGTSMAKIRRLSNDFTPPEDACTTYRLLYENLEGFEKDLHKHVHLENNILFPKALELEKRLNT
ncbi:iron-sulfur cluster repair di-iron protein [Aliifodinibius salipaludis]|uniref:Iron-sulfur cluster repair di-iron protein n=1 Tax=Fodinibius salipaludis TaxID=2032627 RepID=A0A2A2G8E1_9BACT|nr:iron-sulfur cluster repair di-iron protein [Aliifodinibius salipaludis]PAU93274.1 iron-sulfur cluster repair di-iron protein [Aliifodinibius salipaludis]